MHLHLIINNYFAHKEQLDKAWRAKQPRLHCHFIPTSLSWLNLVERWFREISEKAIPNVSSVPLSGIERAIQISLVAWYNDSRPFV